MLALVRTGHVHADVLGLFLGELGQVSPERLEVKPCDLLVQLLGQTVNLRGLTLLEVLSAAVKLELREDLVGERGAHHERGVAGRVTEVEQATFREHDDRALGPGDAVGAHVGRKRPLVDLRLDLGALHTGNVTKASNVDLVVEVTDVAQDRLVLHRQDVLGAHHAHVARGGDHEVGLADHVVQPRDLVAIHRGLQRADRVDLGDDHARALAAQRLRCTLAHIAIPDDERDLSTDQHVGGAVDAIGKGVPDAVAVVELGLGHRVVHVDRGEKQLALASKLFQAVHAGGGFLAGSPNPCRQAREALRVGRKRATQQVEHHELLDRVAALPWLRIGFDGAARLGHHAVVNQKGGVSAVVKNEVGAGVTG